MQIKSIWKKPIKLKSQGIGNFIFYTDLISISEMNGCYVFYNKHGKNISLLYIGKAENLRTRLTQ